MRIISVSAIAVVAIFYLPSSATIINIPDDYSTIQEGIDSSQVGDTVLVQPGTYVENINFNGHNIVLGSLFLTTGDTSYISQTIIDGDSSGTVVTFENSEDSSAVITGFILQNGFAEFGGGIRCDESSPTINRNIINGNSSLHHDGGGGIACGNNSHPFICNNTIAGNSVYGDGGGGIYCRSNSDPVINNNLIIDNDAGSGGTGTGGGILCTDDSDPAIINNNISGNFVGGYNSAAGGGISCHNSNPIIGFNTIINNGAGGYFGGSGGGINCSSNSNPIIYGNNICENHAGDGWGNSGGGIMCFDNSNPIISNNIISGNVAGYGLNSGGGGISTWNSNPVICNNAISGNFARDEGGGVGGNCIIINTILWDNSASEGPQIFMDTGIVAYCDIQDTLWPGEGNISVDPLFRDPDSGDFHLMATYCGDPYNSPCIDMGDPDILDSLLDCDWGLGELRSDMGAYGGSDSAQVSIDDFITRLPSRYNLFQNYPNPFNTSTVIRYELPSPSQVTIELFDILGRQVRTIQDGLQSAGYHQVIWDAIGVSSGIYICRFQAGEYTETRKITLIK